MRFRTSLLMVLVTALAVAATALAGNGPGPAKPEKQRADRPAKCLRGHVTLKGAFVSAGSNSFTMNVRRANRRGRAFLGEQTLMVDSKSRIKRRGKEGPAALSDLVKDDRLQVLARCKQGETAGSFSLLARLVIARPAKPAEPESGS